MVEKRASKRKINDARGRKEGGPVVRKRVALNFIYAVMVEEIGAKTMKLPFLKGSQKQIQWACAIRIDRRKAWGADPLKSSLPNAVYEQLLENDDATFWIAIRELTLAEALEHLQNKVASGNVSNVGPHSSLTPARIQLAKKIKKERLASWRKDPHWKKRTDRQKQWFINRPMEWWLENMNMRNLFDVMMKFQYELHNVTTGEELALNHID